MNGDARLPLLIEALGAIDVELARIHYALREIGAWPSEPSEPTARARSALRRGFATVRMMRQLMVQPTSDSHENRASSLRARGIVVMLQLAELRGLGARDVFGSAFGSLEDFSEHMLSAIGRANAQWIGRSGDAAALTRAEGMFAAIGRDPTVIRGLRHGASSANPHIALTCATLAALLGVARTESFSAPLRIREVTDA